MAQKYRMKSLAGPFTPGQIITEEQAKAGGGDLQFWKSHGAVEEVTDAEAEAAVDLSDAAVKARIESRIRDETAKHGSLSKERQDQIVAEEKGAATLADGPRTKPAPPPAKSQK